MRRIAVSSVVALLLVVAGPALAAIPPALVNYQGVLRDASDKPLTGPYDMIFTFYSDATAGDQILIDSHTAAAGGQVTASGGLFSVQLGSGTITDGSGPGTFTSLADVFRDYATVWLSIQVGSETLAPRVRIVSAAYALNAANLNGQPAGNYLDTSSTPQTKAGPLTLNVTSGNATAVTGTGTSEGG